MGASKQLWGYYPTTGLWLPIKADSTGRLLIDPTNIFEDTPTDGETSKAPTSNWAYNHDHSIFSRFVDIIDWSGALDGWTTALSDSCTVAVQGALLYFVVSNIDGRYAALRTTNSFQRLVETSKVTTVEFNVAWATSVTNVTRWLFISTDTTLTTISETLSHAGFKIVDGDIFASSADGSVQEITDTTVNLATGSQMTALRVEITTGTSVKFYVNGVLKVTHTTRVPTAGSYYILLKCQTDENVVKDWFLHRIGLERTY